MDWHAYFYSEDFKNLAIAIGIFLLFLIIRRIFITYIYKALLKLSRKSPTTLFTEIFLAFEKPLQWLFVIGGIYVAVDFFPYLEQTNELFLKLTRSAVIAMIIRGLSNLTSVTGLFFTKMNKRTNVQIDEILIPFISKGLRLVLIAIGISVIAQEFDYHISGFVAGLGLGGLAFALAAQDAIANLFGGFVIITERPFTIGDWIDTPTVEGTVEDITFRSTIVRTFEEGLVTIPNSTLSNEPITNWSKRKQRRAYFTFKVTYDSPTEKVKNVIRRINTLLKTHPRVDQDSIYMGFTDFKEDGSEIMLYFFTNTALWDEFLKIQEEINFEILDILEDEGVSMAIPSRRLYTDDQKGEKDSEFE